MMTADDESLPAGYFESDAGNDPGFSPSDFDALDRVYSSRVKALTSKASLIRQGCAALEADEILQILKTDPDVFSDARNGHCVGSNDIEADQESLPVGTSSDPLEDFEKDTQSFLQRFAPDNDLFVADNAAWVNSSLITRPGSKGSTPSPLVAMSSAPAKPVAITVLRILFSTRQDVCGRCAA